MQPSSRPPDASLWQTRAAKLFCALVAVGALWFLLRYAASVVVVFLIAWATAALIDPLSRKTAALTHLPRKLWAVLYLVLTLLALGLLGVLAVRRLTREVGELFDWLAQHGDTLHGRLDQILGAPDGLLARFPFLGDAATSLPTLVEQALSRTVSELSTALTAALGRLLRGAPRALITLVVGVMACFYLCLDYQAIRDRLLGLLPTGARGQATALLSRGSRAIRSYARAYLVLFLLTFLEAFVGLTLLRQRYALLLALLIAAVDILPILGTGTVLIPWSIGLFILGEPSVGIGLLILYGVMTIVRQIAEPHLIGGTLGIHPLLSLFSMFLGLNLFGFMGMLLAPGVAVVLKEFLWRRTADSIS